MDNHVSIPDSWMDFSHRNIQASQAARYRHRGRIMMTMLLITIMMMTRSATQRLMGEVDNLVTQCANEMWSHWSNTNMSFQQRIKVPSSRYGSFAALVIIVICPHHCSQETTDAHNKLQSHLSKTMQEIYDQEKHIAAIRWVIRPCCAVTLAK